MRNDFQLICAAVFVVSVIALALGLSSSDFGYCHESLMKKTPNLLLWFCAGIAFDTALKMITNHTTLELFAMLVKKMLP